MFPVAFIPGVTLGLALEKAKQVAKNESAMLELRKECEELTKSVNEVLNIMSSYVLL